MKPMEGHRRLEVDISNITKEFRMVSESVIWSS